MMSKDVNSVAILVPIEAVFTPGPLPRNMFVQITIPTHSRKLKCHKTNK